jgi:sugar phosphate isomerase/epimerase
MADTARYPLAVSTGIIAEPELSSQALAVLNHARFEYMEIGYEHSLPALSSRAVYQNLIGWCGDSTVRVFSIHAPYRPDRDISQLDEVQRRTAVSYTEEAIGLASHLGAKLVAIHGSQDPLEPNTRDKRREQSQKSLAELVRVARECSIRLVLETMPPEWIPAGADEAEAVLEGLDPSVIGYCLDTNHANLTGKLVDIIHHFGDRLWSIHLSDNDGIQQRHWMPFEGVIDFKSVMEALGDIGYRGPLIYELDPHPDGLAVGLAAIEENYLRLMDLT